MRRLTLALTLALGLVAVAPSVMAQSSGGASIVSPAPSATPEQQAKSEEVMRTMYITMGAMAGYLFAVAPVTTAAITAAVASGAASMWAYDYLLSPTATNGGLAQ